MASQTVPPPPIFRLLERLHRIAGHGIKAPRHLARLRVVSRHISAHAKLRASVADNYFPLHDARRARDRVAPLRIYGELLPNRLASCDIKRNQPAVESADVDSSLPNGDAAIHHIATCVRPPLPRNFWIVRPQASARCGVQRKHLAPCGGKVHHAIDDDGSSFLSPVGIEIEVPRQTEPGSIVAVDLLQRTKALLAIRASVGQPVSRLTPRLHDVCVAYTS